MITCQNWSNDAIDRADEVNVIIMAGILTKIYNLLIILRVFYWHTLLATIRALCGLAEKYTCCDPAPRSNGPGWPMTTSKSPNKNYRGHTRWRQVKLWFTPIIAPSPISSCTTSSPTTRPISYPGTFSYIQHGRAHCQSHLHHQLQDCLVF